MNTILKHVPSSWNEFGLAGVYIAASWFFGCLDRFGMDICIGKDRIVGFWAAGLVNFGGETFGDG